MLCVRVAASSRLSPFASLLVYKMYAGQAIISMVMKSSDVKATFGEPLSVVRPGFCLCPAHLTWVSAFSLPAIFVQGWNWDGELLPTSVAVHIPIAGPKATGVVFGRAVRLPEQDKWIVLVCEVKVDGQAVLPSERPQRMPSTVIDALPPLPPAGAVSTAQQPLPPK